MNRCTPRFHPRSVLASLALGAAAAVGLSLPLPAQAQRIFPHTATRGIILFENGSGHILLNGQPETLAIGAQVRDQHNRVPLAGSLRGKSFVVNYVRDPSGKVRQVWLLTEKEASSPGRQESALKAARGAQWRAKRQGPSEAHPETYRN